MIRIYWESLVTGAIGHREWQDISKKEAKRIVKALNKEYADILRYWYVEKDATSEG